MKNGLVKLAVVLVLMNLSLPPQIQAAVDWTLRKQFPVEGTPLDLATSPDGRTIYILVPGKILIYSVAENRVTDFLPIDRKLDKLSYVAKDNVFLLANSKDQVVQVFQMEKRARVDLSGLPVKGPADAPVTIAVYSDYQ